MKTLEKLETINNIILSCGQNELTFLPSEEAKAVTEYPTIGLKLLQLLLRKGYFDVEVPNYDIVIQDLLQSPLQGQAAITIIEQFCHNYNVLLRYRNFYVLLYYLDKAADNTAMLLSDKQYNKLIEAVIRMLEGKVDDQRMQISNFVTSMINNSVAYRKWHNMPVQTLKPATIWKLLRIINKNVTSSTWIRVEDALGLSENIAVMISSIVPAKTMSSLEKYFFKFGKNIIIDQIAAILLAQGHDYNLLSDYYVRMKNKYLPDVYNGCVYNCCYSMMALVLTKLLRNPNTSEDFLLQSCSSFLDVLDSCKKYPEEFKTTYKNQQHFNDLITEILENKFNAKLLALIMFKLYQASYNIATNEFMTYLFKQVNESMTFDLLVKVLAEMEQYEFKPQKHVNFKAIAEFIYLIVSHIKLDKEYNKNKVLEIRKYYKTILDLLKLNKDINSVIIELCIIICPGKEAALDILSNLALHNIMLTKSYFIDMVQRIEEIASYIYEKQDLEEIINKVYNNIRFLDDPKISNKNA